MAAPRIELTVALPVYNEALILASLHERVTRACEQLDTTFEVLYVNDGSTDGTKETLQKIADEDARTTVINLSRNFGHPTAVTAAINLAAGRRLVLMDADFQDDPDLIPDLLRVQKETGAEVVYVVRSSREEGLLLRVVFKLFHWVLARTATYPLPRDTGTFGLIGSRALEAIRAFTEKLRYFPGLRAFVGFTQVPVFSPRGPRYDRTSRVGIKGLVKLALLALFAEARAPAMLFYWLAGMSLTTSLALTTYALVGKGLGIAVAAWTSTIVSISFFGGIIVLGQAFICEYLARIYEEVRARPGYIVESIQGSRQSEESIRGPAPVTLSEHR